MGRNQPESLDDIVILTHPQAGDSQPMPRVAVAAHEGNGWSLKEVVHYAIDATYDDTPAAPATSWGNATTVANDDEV